jgi:glycerate kinase
MRVLIAADTFKDALSAAAVCAAIARGLQERMDVQTIQFPLADGGEGTLDVLANHLQLQIESVATVDALQRPIQGRLGFSANKGLAVIEAATVCGLSMLRREERNPLWSTTRGIGFLLQAAMQHPSQRIAMAIGGTATNDGGVGMARCLGWQFFDSSGSPLQEGGAALVQLARIEAPRAMPRATQIDVLCDVTNPLFGPQGAACVYARQKGANDAGVALLDEGLQRLARVVTDQKLSTVTPDFAGAGAAGGLGYGAMVFLGASLRRGIETVLELAHFDDALAQADVVVTGEGRLDEQTLHGKLIQGVATRAAKLGKPVIALCGQLTVTREQLQAMGVTDAYVIDESSRTLAQKIAATAANLTRVAARMRIDCN